MEEYKSTRAEAEHTAALLRAALKRVGISDDEVAKVRPVVTATGRAYVHFGAFQLRDAAAVLEALSLSRPVPHGADSHGEWVR